MRYAWWLAAVVAVAPAMAQDIYGGPAVLSRPPVGNLSASSDLLVIRPSLRLLGSYESGLYLPATDLYGNQTRSDSFGVSAVVGLGGYHRWRHTLLGLDYRGSFRHYTRYENLDGTDQSVSLSVQHQASSRTMFTLSGVGGTYSRGYGVWAANLNYGDYSQGVDPTTTAVTNTDLLDARTYYAGGSADVIHQKTARLSVRLGGGAFAVRRRSRGLAELNGYTGRGDITYRVGRRSNIGVDYQYMDYRFVRAFGTSNIHIAAGSFSHQLDRNWAFALRAGVLRVESLRVERVELDPVVAALIGQTAGLEATFRVNYGSMIGVALSRNFRRAGLTFRYDRGVTPGNAIFLTSRADVINATYSYRGWRRWAASLSGSHSRYTTILQDYGNYEVSALSASTSYRLGRFVHLVGSIAGRSFDMRYLQGGRRRNSYVVTFGIGFTPNEMPLSLW